MITHQASTLEVMFQEASRIKAQKKRQAIYERSLMESTKTPRVISVTSGKGGVGKTSISCNLALALQRQGQRVLLIDADLGLANIDVLLGLAPQYTLNDLFKGDITFPEILLEGPEGVQVLPASSGITELESLSEDHKVSLMESVDEMADFFDFVIIDTGAGISSNVLYFNAAAQEVLVVTNQEPTAMTDAYALMKVLSTKSRVNRFKLLVNEVSTAAQAKDVFKKLSLVSDQYLNIGIDYLGFIYSDKQVSQSVRKQAPFLSVFPDSPASRCVEVVSERLLKDPRMKGPTGNMQFFFNRLLDHSDLS